MPVREHSDDAGMDIFSTETVMIPPHSHRKVHTGLHVEIPAGCFGLLTSKSGMMDRDGITCRGTIDRGYTGEVGAVLFNHTDEPYMVAAGQKVTQMVIVPCITPALELVDELDGGERGDHGFGSTGV